MQIVKKCKQFAATDAGSEDEIGEVEEEEEMERERLGDVLLKQERPISSHGRGKHAVDMLNSDARRKLMRC